jgi:hypothetical protein
MYEVQQRVSGKVCGTRILITQEMLAAARGATVEEKYEDIKAEAAAGCKWGCFCMKAKAWIETREVEGEVIAEVVTQCLSAGRVLSSAP